MGLRAPVQVKARDRVLSDDEVRVIWKTYDQHASPFTAFCKFLLITGQRRGEVARMTWDELNEAGDEWTIPAARVKNKREHVVPLSPLAQEILAGVKKIRGEFVFTTNGNSPIGGFSKSKRRLDQVISDDLPELAQWRLHDLRRTCASGMARLGQPVHIVEAVLNHKSGAISGVAAVYNRYDYAKEKRAALTAWSSLLREITTGAGEKKVVALHGRRKKRA